MTSGNSGTDGVDPKDERAAERRGRSGPIWGALAEDEEAAAAQSGQAAAADDDDAG